MISEDRVQRDPALKRLLGPPGDELTCEQCFEMLDEYVDLDAGGIGAESRVPGAPTWRAAPPAERTTRHSVTS